MIFESQGVFGALGVAAIAFIIIWGNALAFVVDTKATEKGLEFVFLHCLRFCIVPYENISFVENAGMGFPKFFAYNLKTRPLEKKYYLELKRGWFTRKLLISPAASEDLIGKLQKAGIQLGVKRY